MKSMNKKNKKHQLSVILNMITKKNKKKIVSIKLMGILRNFNLIIRIRSGE